MTAVTGVPDSSPGVETGLVDARPASTEVSTTSADGLRASVKVDGALTDRSCALVLGVITTHVRAGRLHLRVGLRGAVVVDDEVYGHLAQAHRCVQDAGGVLVFDDVAPALARDLRRAGLMVVPAA